MKHSKSSLPPTTINTTFGTTIGASRLPVVVEYSIFHGDPAVGLESGINIEDVWLKGVSIWELIESADHIIERLTDEAEKDYRALIMPE